MIRSRNALIGALLFPILALAALAVHHAYLRDHGQEVTLPISGYDPRDLLAGHYLTYQIDYGVPVACPYQSSGSVAFICLEPKSFSYTYPRDCARLIRGTCLRGRFEAGVERFYVPEQQAPALDKAIRAKSASIVLSLGQDGQAQVKDLLIDGHHWSD